MATKVEILQSLVDSLRKQMDDENLVSIKHRMHIKVITETLRFKEFEIDFLKSQLADQNSDKKTFNFLDYMKKDS